MNFGLNLRTRNSKTVSKKWFNYLFFGVLRGLGTNKNNPFGQCNYLFFPLLAFAKFNFNSCIFAPFSPRFVPFCSYTSSSGYSLSIFLSLSLFILSLSLSLSLFNSCLSLTLSPFFSLHLLHSSFLSLPSLPVFPTPRMFHKSFACRNPIPGPEAWQLLGGDVS